MKITQEELAGVPGATKRRGWLLDIAVDLLINLGESVFGKVIDHVRTKRAERLKTPTSQG